LVFRPIVVYGNHFQYFRKMFLNLKKIIISILLNVGYILFWVYEVYTFLNRITIWVENIIWNVLLSSIPVKRQAHSNAHKPLKIVRMTSDISETMKIRKFSYSFFNTYRFTKKNKEERYSRVPRLSDTRYSKGNGDMQAAKRD